VFIDTWGLPGTIWCGLLFALLSLLTIGAKAMFYGGREECPNLSGASVA
jgi:hypothetical protein